MKHSFYFERMTDKPTGMLVDISSKMKEEKLSLQGKQLAIFVANDKI